MGTTYELTAAVREKVGKGAARATRRQGHIPAVIYGGKQPALPISLSYWEIDQKVHGGGFLTTLATIDVAGDKIRVIPREYQIDPVNDRPLHVDFLRVPEGARLTLDVPVHFVNEGAAPGIRRGGVLNIVRHTINVSCPAEAIPEELVCDLTGLDINDSVHISAMQLPEGVLPTITDRDFTVATIAAPAGVKEEIRAAAEAAAAASEAAEGEEGEAAAGEEEDKEKEEDDKE